VREARDHVRAVRDLGQHCRRHCSCGRAKGSIRSGTRATSGSRSAPTASSSRRARRPPSTCSGADGSPLASSAPGRRKRAPGQFDTGSAAAPAPRQPRQTGASTCASGKIGAGTGAPPVAAGVVVTCVVATGYVVPGKGVEPPLPKREPGPQRSAYPLSRKDLRPRVVHCVYYVYCGHHERSACASVRWAGFGHGGAVRCAGMAILHL
jgi:hypothetical protein